ncbi:MAG: ABC transporter ATP-binding protein/permease [Chloroflexi bacterium]|nr:ABC transporter ATP-binding protein/permease [Chloroflexota bacterium]MCI0580835.1 ABC transporter ATP-binding protein/permease [Chloroflexota bacterium]MCI0648171.1 ABC transporter ATP-binding protein/permease [Chloroflexota bacterium]MCI0730313.1 ABC transporter ATP-binding protein/permease [Chloroflexota bacterium]
MGFILDGLETEAYDRQYSDRELLRRIASYFRPYSKRMILVAIMLTLNSLAGTAGPVLIARAIDIIAETPTTEAMLLLAGGILLLGVFAWYFNYIRQLFSARVIGNVVLQLRQDVFNATIQHDLSFFDEHPSGKIVSRVTSDTQDFSEVASLVMNLISQVLLVGILSVWLFSINTWLTLLMLAITPLAVVLALSFRRVARRVTQNARRVTAKINAQIQESISGIMVAKNFRQEPAIYAAFDANNRQGYAVGLRRGLTLMAIFPVVGLASGLSTAALIYAGGLATRGGGAVSPGEWYLFMQAVGFYWFPILGIASFWSQFQDGLSAAERVFALIDREPRVTQTAAEPVPDVAGRIEFRHVHLTYTGKEIVLPDFSLVIEAGETVALVGHTGAGKSSIARLVTRFYEFQGGQLLVDGRDIRCLDLDEYRRHIGLVPQEPFLFSGTIRDNIRYSRPEAGDAEVMEAAVQIGRGDWLEALPAGLDTDVGERGSNLSMGQRQLVALARVLLKDPAIFILDEATASVDPFTETQIQEGLETIMRDRTAIVIAHRLSTVKNADRTIVMDHGRIIEEGDHDTLLARGGHYAELYNTYFRHQSLEYIESFPGRAIVVAPDSR